MTPTHLVILGRQPELGLAELESHFGDQTITPFGKKATLLSEDIDLDRFGGIIKVGQILYHGPANDLLTLPIDWGVLTEDRPKLTIGLSYYGVRATTRFVLSVGLELKKRLKTSARVRLVAPTKGTDLTAAQLHHNKVLADGFELMVVVNGQQMVVARTTAVQDIEAYSARDYARPARSATVGMLPPKLAQIMLNTTQSRLVVDPFCGTGVVLQEALLAGRSAVGYDLAPEMVAATTTNLEWLATQTPAPLPAWHVQLADAQVGQLPEADVAVVSEGYLGPNLTHWPTASELTKLDHDISQLYLATLTNWARQLAPGATIALCIPNWRVKSGWHVPAVVDDLRKIGYTSKVFRHVHGVIRYARSDQIVGRQLLLLTRS